MYEEKASIRQNVNQPPQRREYLILFAIILLTACLLQLPYLLGEAATQPNQVYMHLIMNPEDSQSYWAKMQNGFAGDWLYSIPFTPEPHDPALVGVFYVALGQLARVTGLSLTAVWHLSRFIATLILIPTIFAFVATFTRQRRTRWTAFLLALFGSGLGWLLLLLQQPYWLNAFPVDFKQPGAHIFFTAFTFPHIIIATAAILGAVWCYHQLGKPYSVSRKPYSVTGPRMTDDELRITILANICNLTISITYPFLIYLVFATAVLYGLYLCWQQRRILWRTGFLFAATFLLALPLNLYYVFVLAGNPIFRTWSDQSVTLSAPWPHYLLAFGPYLLPAALHWWQRPSDRRETAVLWAWILATAILLYAPLNPQRRFIQGVHVPLSILAALGMVHAALPRLAKTRVWQKVIALPRYEPDRLRRFVLVLFLLLMSVGNLYLWLDVTRTAVLIQPYPLIRPAAEQETLAWLRKNGTENTTVLAAYQTGSYIAGRSPFSVMTGHWTETAAFAQKEALVQQFFSAEAAHAQRKEILNHYDISYVWHGPQERALGDFDPATADYLTAVFQTDTITLYAVLIDEPQSSTIPAVSEQDSVSSKQSSLIGDQITHYKITQYATRNKKDTRRNTQYATHNKEHT